MILATIYDMTFAFSLLLTTQRMMQDESPYGRTA